MKYDNTNNIQNIKASKYFRKADILVVIIILVMFIGMMFLIFMPTGDKVVIRVDGKVKYTYNLDENKVINLTINGEENANIIVIENGYVYMKSATCKNDICVKSGKINKVGETICCLPHNVVVEIIGKGGMDTVV